MTYNISFRFSLVWEIRSSVFFLFNFGEVHVSCRIRDVFDPLKLFFEYVALRIRAVLDPFILLFLLRGFLTLVSNFFNVFDVLN